MVDVLVTDDAVIDPSVLNCSQLTLGEIESVDWIGDGADDLPPSFFVRVEWRELRHVAEGSATDINDLAQVERDAIPARAQSSPADDMLLTVVEAAEELLDLLASPQRALRKSRGQTPHGVHSEVQWSLTGSCSPGISQLLMGRLEQLTGIHTAKTRARAKTVRPVAKDTEAALVRLLRETLLQEAA
ncbi:hypothetical protein ACIBF1_22825 [Spirillospora sp. NPDC050679]